MAMLIFVLGSVHEEDEEFDEVVAAVVVQVMAVLAGAACWHEIRTNAPINTAKKGRRLTAPLS